MNTNGFQIEHTGGNVYAYVYPTTSETYVIVDSDAQSAPADESDPVAVMCYPLNSWVDGGVDDPDINWLPSARVAFLIYGDSQ